MNQKWYKAHCQYGYYGKTVIVRVDELLKTMPKAQAGIVFYGSVPFLMSYESVIMGYDAKQDRFIKPAEVGFPERYTAAPDYSRTTAKHVGAFCKEYAPKYTYFDVKRWYYTN